jgi:hypothetical protein
MSQSMDIRRFFQKAPRKWLQRYFHERGLLTDLDWNTVKVRNVDSLFEAWSALGAAKQDELCDDFRNIQLLATPAGKMAILDEANEVDDFDVVAEELAKLDGFFECAFWALLQRRRLWDGAIFFAAADSKPKRYWRKRINLPGLKGLSSGEDAERLSNAVADLFRQMEARGHFCHCERYRRRQKVYYFLYPQDHPQTPLQYDEKGQCTKRPCKFAFEIVMIHDDDAGSLSVWHQGTNDRVKDLQVLFAKHVLNADIPRGCPKDDRVYDLSSFMDPDYQLKPQPALGIKGASIRKIRVQVTGPEPHSIHIDLARHCPDHVLHERLHSATRDIPRSLLRVTLVGIQATFELEEDERRNRPRTFEIAAPNSCSLENTSKDILLQRMLVENGIEPRQKPPADGDW